MRNPVRSLFRQLAPSTIIDYFEELQGRIENLEKVIDTLIERPVYDHSASIALNQQHHRRAMFHELAAVEGMEMIVETGTWIGETAAYMATSTGLPVHTCELNPRYYQLAQKRTEAVSGITFNLADSRSFLHSIADRLTAAKRVFCYLDAHWYNDLPLKEEVQLIARYAQSFVIMIDDFEVPGDEGYKFDDYGPGKTLNRELLQTEINANDMGVFYPSIPSSQETGLVHGCIVLCSTDLKETLAGESTLSPA
ncbi:MAG: hypothetical protein AAFW89_11970 [Bacteroidota bacterium]